MKGSAIFTSACHPWSGCRQRGGGDSDCSAVLQPGLAAGHHAVTAAEAACNHGEIAVLRARLKRAHAGAPVACDYPRIESVGAALHGGGGYRQRTFLCFQKQPGIHELTRPERFVRVGKSRLDRNRAGCGIGDVVDEQGLAGCQCLLIVCIERSDFDVAPLQSAPHAVGIAFGQGEQDRDRLDLCQDHDRSCVARLDKVSWIDLAYPGACFDRGLDRRVVELGLCAFNGRPIHLDGRLKLAHEGGLVIEVLDSLERVGDERAKPLEVLLRADELRLVFRELAFGLIQRCLINAGSICARTSPA